MSEDFSTESDFCSKSIASGFAQVELNDLVTDLYLSKGTSEL